MAVKVRERKGAWWLFIDHQGKRKAKRVGEGKEGKRAAQVAAEKIQAKLALGEFSLADDNTRKSPTVQEAVDRWLATHVQLEQIRETTHKEYARSLSSYVYPRLGSKPVTAVTRADVRDLLVDLKAQGKSRSVARNLLAPLSQTFTQLIEDGVLTSNPALRLGRYLKEPTDQRSRVEVLRPDEEVRLLNGARVNHPHHFCLFLAALRTGCG